MRPPGSRSCGAHTDLERSEAILASGWQSADAQPTLKTVTIAARFCGPPTSANGGYFAGRVAALATRTVGVRLLTPPPLDAEFAVTELEDGGLKVRHGEELIGEAHPAEL